MIEVLFLDVGGVLGTNGWGRDSRRAAAERFGLNQAEMDERHHLTFDTYERGNMSLDTYLDKVVFYQPRDFSKAQFVEFMMNRSQPYPEMIELVTQLKRKHSLRVVIVSNEGRELTLHRVASFSLGKFVDAYIFSSFVHFRKPDHEIYQLALDVTMVTPDRVLYLDDRPMFVETAAQLGIRGIVHSKDNLEATRAQLAEFGLG